MMPPRYVALIVCGGFACGGVQAQPPHLLPPGAGPTVGYLGIGYRDIDAERAKALKLPQEAGVEVTRLVPGSPAGAAGIRVGDVVMQYNGQVVEGQVQLSRLISETPTGRDVKIQVFRNGYAQSLIAKIGARPREVTQIPVIPLGPSGAGAFPDVPLTRMSWRNGLGAEWEAVDGQLGMAFGVKDGGVLVRSVTAGSPADKGGLRAGDVIIRVGDARVNTPADVSGRIRAVREQAASLSVVRDKKEISLSIPLDGSRGQ